MTAKVKQLIEIYFKYYVRKNNWKKTTKHLRAICDEAKIPRNFLPYVVVNDIDYWHETIVWWFHQEKLLW